MFQRPLCDCLRCPTNVSKALDKAPQEASGIYQRRQFLECGMHKWCTESTNSKYTFSVAQLNTVSHLIPYYNVYIYIYINQGFIRATGKMICGFSLVNIAQASFELSFQARVRMAIIIMLHRVSNSRNTHQNVVSYSKPGSPT